VSPHRVPHELRHLVDVGVAAVPHGNDEGRGAGVLGDQHPAVEGVDREILAQLRQPFGIRKPGLREGREIQRLVVALRVRH
jgi:hypothetical protein